MLESDAKVIGYPSTVEREFKEKGEKGFLPLKASKPTHALVWKHSIKRRGEMRKKAWNLIQKIGNFDAGD